MKDAVYLLSSILNPDKTYTGQSSRCVYVRLAEHNRGQTSYTKRLRPLRLVVSVWGFNSKAAAMRFEKLWKRRSRGGLVAHLEALVRLVRSRNDLHIISHVNVSGINYEKEIDVAQAHMWIEAEAGKLIEEQGFFEV